MVGIGIPYHALVIALERWYRIRYTFVNTMTRAVLQLYLSFYFTTWLCTNKFDDANTTFFPYPKQATGKMVLAQLKRELF